MISAPIISGKAGPALSCHGFGLWRARLTKTTVMGAIIYHSLSRHQRTIAMMTHRRGCHGRTDIAVRVNLVNWNNSVAVGASAGP